MSPELEAKIYQTVVRDVMWGKDRAEIDHMLKVNGIEGEAAEKMFRRAWGERTAVVRSEGIRKALLGLVFFAAGAGALSAYVFGAGWITRNIAIICGTPMAFGAWWMLEGGFKALLASKSKGPIATESV